MLFIVVSFLHMVNRISTDLFETLRIIIDEVFVRVTYNISFSYFFLVETH